MFKFLFVFTTVGYSLLQCQCLNIYICKENSYERLQWVIHFYNVNLALTGLPYLYHSLCPLLRRFDRPQRFKPFISRCMVQGNVDIGSFTEVDLKFRLPVTTTKEKLKFLHDDDEHILAITIIAGDHRLKIWTFYIYVQLQFVSVMSELTFVNPNLATAGQLAVLTQNERSAKPFNPLRAKKPNDVVGKERNRLLERNFDTQFCSRLVTNLCISRTPSSTFL